MLGSQSQAQEAVDSARASFAKSHFTTETVSKVNMMLLAKLLFSIILLNYQKIGYFIIRYYCQMPHYHLEFKKVDEEMESI